MWHLTTQERLVLLSLAGTVWAGACLDYGFKKIPFLQPVKHFLENDQQLAVKIDLNVATLEDLVALPHIGPVTAQRILDYRNQNGNFKRCDELQDIRGITLETFHKIAPFVRVTAPPEPRHP